MYTYLKKGYKLPTVGVLQVLLNRGVSENELKKDGEFGKNTKQAVRNFQKPRGLHIDGIVGKNTWPRLIAGTGFRIIDAVDITDPGLFTEVNDIRSIGGNPSLIGSMCNGIGNILQALIARMRERGEVVLLRFFGHGNSGIMGISDGEDVMSDRDLTSLTSDVIDLIAGELSRVGPLFGRYSSVELHGCKVGYGPSGRRLLQKLANIWQVPVSGGIKNQISGGISTFRFEGPVFTAFPGGATLRQWAMALPDLPKQTIN